MAQEAEERGVKRLRKSDYAVDAVTVAKMLRGKWLCRRLNDGTVLKAMPRIGIGYATKRDQNRKWRFVAD